MTAVDFYKINDSDPASLSFCALRLACKSWRAGHHTYVHCSSEEQANALLTQLNTLSDHSLIPGYIGSHQAQSNGIAFGYDESHAPIAEADIMIQLSTEISKCFSRFARLLEITNTDEQHASAKREAWKFYKSRGYPLRYHEI